MSKFSTPFFKKSPILGAYENAADGRAFMGGLVSGQQQFAKLQQDITKGFENYVEGEGTQQRMEKNSLDKINEKYPLNTETDKRPDGYEAAILAHNKRFNTKGGVKCPQGETFEPIRLPNGETLYKCMKNNE